MPANRDVALVAREVLEGAYVLLTFRHPEVAREARAGQFVMIKAGTSADPPLRRPFSILAVDPERETFSLFLKAVGAGSRALADLPPGGAAQCVGPLGRPFEPPSDGSEALMVAGGYGIAPFLLFVRELRRAGRTGRVFYGGRTVADLQVREPFTALGVSLVPATEDGSLGHRGRVTAPLEEYLDGGPGPATLYACGPDAMMRAVARVAERRGLPAQVSLDPWMGCGVGTCLGCVVRIQRPDEPQAKYRCACTEGPVFDAATVVWPGEAASLARRRAVEVKG
ncbi:MAG: dihydroorotate dehydrogenase electron transfer subunit [Acidobacteria bacterium]|nr:dihydroorotate dehydrogenase electron transfer subunit [Acidobacteriota bacterium]